jgi:hypothetical protein
VDLRFRDGQHLGKKAKEARKPIVVVPSSHSADHTKSDKGKRVREDEEEVDSADQIQSHRVALFKDE